MSRSRKIPLKSLSTPSPAKFIIPCDRCGYSKQDAKDERLFANSYPMYEISAHIANARFEIRVNNGSIFLCAHHYHKHEPYLAQQGYQVMEIK